MVPTVAEHDGFAEWNDGIIIIIITARDFTVVRMTKTERTRRD